MHDAPGDHQPLRHATGERGDVRLRAIGEAEHLEEIRRHAPGGLRTHPEVAAVEVEVLPDAQAPVERVRLRDDADQALGLRRVRDDVDAREPGPALGRDDAGREHPDRGRLAGAVRAEQPEDLTLVHVEVEVDHRADVAGVDLRELLGMDHDPGGRRHRGDPLVDAGIHVSPPTFVRIRSSTRCRSERSSSVRSAQTRSSNRRATERSRRCSALPAAVSSTEICRRSSRSRERVTRPSRSRRSRCRVTVAPSIRSSFASPVWLAHRPRSTPFSTTQVASVAPSSRERVLEELLDGLGGHDDLPRQRFAFHTLTYLMIRCLTNLTRCSAFVNRGMRASWSRGTAGRLGPGRVAERTKAAVLKTAYGATRTWVRIPPLPPPVTDTSAPLRGVGTCATCSSYSV